MYQAGTLSGNPLATAAGLAALDLLDDGAYAALDGHGADRLAGGLRDGDRRRPGSPVDVPRRRHRCVGLLLRRRGPPSTTPTRQAHRRRRATRAFFHAMLDRGVALAPGPYEIVFPGLAHTDE